MKPILYIVIPCYNEEQVLPITCTSFSGKIRSLMACNQISPDSKVLFVDDGSHDGTWQLIENLAEADAVYRGLRLSRNRGHQNALLAGLMEAKEFCDISISIDCDGQDDINAMDEMVQAYLDGNDVVYGVRSRRASDTAFKQITAQGFYKVMKALGADIVYNHADYRLLSKRVLQALGEFKEVNLFLRGLIPLVGFSSTSVYYERTKRIAGKSHYPLGKMLALAFNGITSLSVKPIAMITGLGTLISLISFLGVIWSVVVYFMGKTVSGWASLTCIVCLLGGIQLISIGVLGEYIGKIYLETKARPRFIIEKRTFDEKQE